MNNTTEWTPKANDRVEWNPTGDGWQPAVVQPAVVDGPNVVIRLEDGTCQNLLAENRHLRPAKATLNTTAVDEAAAFVDRVLTGEAWAESGVEVVEQVTRILAQASSEPTEQASQDEIGALTAQRNDAQRAGLKFLAQLDEIRAVVAEWQTNPEATGGGGMEAIRAILERPAGSPVTETTKQRRVWFEGDTVPAQVPVMDTEGGVHEELQWDWIAPYTVVELMLPSRENVQAVVNRARAERSGVTSETEKRP